MSLKHTATVIKDYLYSLDPAEKRSFLLLCFAYFFSLLSYSIVRSATESMFLQSYGGKSSPIVWIYSVLVLSLSVYFFNRFQERFSVRHLYFVTSIFSTLLFIFGTMLYQAGFSWLAYPLFIWKEVYVILLIHMALGFLNASTSLESAKILYGPLGLFGGLGGIIGGVAVSQLTYLFTTEWILIVGTLTVLISGFCFLGTDKSVALLRKSDHEGESPLQSIQVVGKYVALICLLVALTQFAINLANYKFNVMLSDLIVDKEAKTRFIGNLNALINAIAFVAYFFIPFITKTFKLRTIQLAIPLLFLVTAILGFGVGGSLLMPVAITFLIFKGTDYSIFSMTKELLYFPLSRKQRYGAKYIADMVCYRLSKGVISAVLLFFTSTLFINSALLISLILWVLIVVWLFKEEKSIHEKVENT